MSLIDVSKTGKIPAKPRSHAIDLVRLIGIVAIVAGHSSTSAWVSPWLFSWHVPVFFVISGYLWSPSRSTKLEFTKRARTLLLPYVTWLVIVSVLWFGFRMARGESIDWSFSQNLLLGGWYIPRPYSAFWFVTALFIATVLMRWLSNLSPFLPWFVGAIGVAWCTVDPETAKRVPESAGVALAAILFMCLGSLLRNYRNQITSPLKFGLVLLIPALFLSVSGAVDGFNMKSADLGTPILGVLIGVAISCGLILVCEAIGPMLPSQLGSTISIVAQTGLAIILSHTLVLAIAAQLGMVSAKLIFLLALFIPLAFALSIRRTQASRFFM
ncbi:acyltransferase family protein [Cryobacterium tepidiphilum]|uniref:Acyltransferase 3 domain-containing protein n=1 Tax=Cryobacterium tepidiphilum TaxID=2486026 RepID=A0A3M8L1E7_9MICO|nr:acyltransferase family protein [Cryobacterium tepidiphilum]RNE59095.1 hypothetical protein EEJ31_11295 [Cryobacterium tepidiphilum]